MKYSLEHVKKTYRLWGRHPFLYKLACIITFLGYENKLRELAVNKLNLKKGAIVLDLACGTGLNFKNIEQHIGSSGSIIAFDYSKDMIDAAKERAIANNWKNIEFIQGDAAELALNKKVDGVLSTLGISAIPEYKKALKNAVSALKPNKNISILDAKLPSGLLSVFNPVIAYIYKHRASWDYTKDIPSELRKLAPNAVMEEHNFGTIYIIHSQKLK